MSLWNFRSYIAIAVVAWALPGWTHHSHGNYDLATYTTIEGAVTEAHWINPHTWIYLEVANLDGTATVWHWKAEALIHLRDLVGAKKASK